MTDPEQALTLDEAAAQFVAHRPKLSAIATRTLGSPWSAEDALQETWIRLQRADVAKIDSLEAWLTTVISRVCIDMIRRQAGRREDLAGEAADGSWPRPVHAAGGAPIAAPTEPTEPTDPTDPADPADAVLRSEDLALAMQVVLEHLGPLERLALVLHDVFALSYAEIAPIVERTPVAARQLASRARGRLRTVEVGEVRRRQNAAITAFLEAARGGDFGSLLQLLDPEIELRSDRIAVEIAAEGAEHGAPLLEQSVRGRDAVARVFAGRAELTRPVLVGGVPAAAYVSGGIVQAIYLVTFDDGWIARLDVLADPAHLAALPVTLLEAHAAATRAAAGGVPSQDPTSSQDRETVPGRAAQLAARRREVQAQLQDIERELVALRRAREGVADDDEHDPDGVPLSEQWSRLEGLRLARSEALAGIDEALARRERGEDGLCQRCGSPIAPARLAVRPEATTCIDCA